MAKKLLDPVAVSAPLTLPTTIGADEATYLQTLIAQRQHAEVTLQSFTAYLAKKYQLGEGDGLQPNGTITRKAQA